MDAKVEKMDSKTRGLVLVAGVASYLDSSLLVSLGIALPIWVNTLSLSAIMTGFLSTLLTLMVALGSVVGGWLSDRFGRVRVFNLDILFVAVGAIIIAFATNIGLLLIGIVLAGLASGADLPTSLAVISERTSSKMYGRAITITQIFWTIGILMSQFIGFLTAGMTVGSVQSIFGIIAVVAFINWCIRVFSKKFRENEEELEKKAKKNMEVSGNEMEKIGVLDILKKKQYLVALIMLTLFYLFWNLPANTWGSFVNYFLETVSGKSQAYATLVALVANIFNLLSNIIYVKLSDTKYRYPVMYLAIVIGTLAFFCAGTWSSIWWVFTIAYVIYSATNTLCGEPIYKIWTQTFYPVEVRASITGVSYGFVRFITAIFSLFTPLLMHWSVSNFLWIIFGCSLSSGVLAILIVRMLHNRGLE
ncbi:MFS transporter [Ligilactobacillus equi]|uniref:Disaccharride transporter, major facilitator super family (MFS) n=1 Tax=Ligilactobacillus equi DPC 6820 TaxID=1392007 RepID=V7HVL6_9LACO|nr:MFS transporter [Ligilactobacillus equi]ETA73263.1 disaccharride transporter, major facilitator super family (MFS) [Ligilactobacillus equi DPC 6820]